MACRARENPADREKKKMDILPDENEALVKQAAREFLENESTPERVRATQMDQSGFDADLWGKFAELGWMALSLPESHGGQGMPLSYSGLLLEEVGRSIAPLPVYSTLVATTTLLKHSPEGHRELIQQVATGDAILTFAVEEGHGEWNTDAIALSGRWDGDELVLSGSKHFVENFNFAQKCLVALRLEDGGKLALALVDTGGDGVSADKLITLANDDVSHVRFDNVRVSRGDVLQSENGEGVADLMDYAAILLVPQMEGAARRAMEFAIEYVKQREAFGQPIGAFQAIQHMSADMINAVDGAQLLNREALWLLSLDEPAQMEISQAKAFANEKCLMACRSAHQMHGGIGFIAEFDLNLWYRRVAAWTMRAGTNYEHRARVASGLLDTKGDARLGMKQGLPA
jgi:alkylation response protein AidB-like acyl-CoA dehydrogenase